MFQSLGGGVVIYDLLGSNITNLIGELSTEKKKLVLSKIDDLLEQQRNYILVNDTSKETYQKHKGEYMSPIKRLEGKRDFLMRIISSVKELPLSSDTISNLLNIPWQEVDYINQEFDNWKKEQLQKKLGAAEVLEQIKSNNPKYRLDSQKYNLSLILGISMEELIELEDLLENKATINK